MGASQKRSKNPKELVGPGGLYTISTKKKYIVEKWLHKGEGGDGLDLGAVNVGKWLANEQ